MMWAGIQRQGMLKSVGLSFVVMGLFSACAPEETVKPEPVVVQVDEEQLRREAAEKDRLAEIERQEANQRYQQMVKDLARKQREQRVLDAMQAKQKGQVTAAKDEVLKPASTRKVAPTTKPVKQERVQPPKRKQTYRTGNEVSGQNRLYDPENQSYDLIQKANESLKGFPTNRIGEVDWMVAIDQKLVKPRSDVFGKTQPELLDLDIIMKGTREMNYVRFPHLTHTKWLACSNCHDKIFKRKTGAHKIDMNKIFEGKYCGVCHDKVAFSVFICENCHSVPHE